MKKRWLIILGFVVVLVGICISVLVATHQTRHDVNTVQPKNSLRITEWNMGLPLPPTIADAYYTYDANTKTVFISTKHLDALAGQVHDCTSGLHGLYYKKTRANPPVLAEQRLEEPTCGTVINSQTEQIETIQTSIRSAAQAVYISK
jgi:hypothetical protein